MTQKPFIILVVIFITTFILNGGIITDEELIPSKDTDDLTFTDKVRGIEGEFGWAFGLSIFDFPVWTGVDYHPAKNTAIGGVAMLAGIRLTPVVLEEIEMALHFTADENYFSISGSNVVSNFMYDRKSGSLCLSYIIKARFPQVYKTALDEWHYLHYFIGGGLTGHILMRTSSDIYTTVVSATTATTLPMTNYAYSSFRFGAQAVAGITFSFRDTPMALGFQVKYTRLFARFSPMFVFAESLAEQPYMFTFEITLVKNFWRLKGGG